MVIGNPNLAPESSTSWQLGTTLQFRNRMTVDINGFYNRVKDLIQTDEDNGTNVRGIMVYTYDNISRAETLGHRKQHRPAAVAPFFYPARLHLDRHREPGYRRDADTPSRTHGRAVAGPDLALGDHCHLPARAATRAAN